MPVDDALAGGLGYSLEDINAAVTTARRAAIRVCLQDRGWTITDITMRGFDDSTEPVSGTVAFFIAEVTADSQATTPERDPVWDDPTFADDASDCIITVEAHFPNPTEDMLTLREDVNHNLSVTALSDPRYLEANHRYSQCMSELGYDANEATTLQSNISTSAANVVARYKQGQITKAAALNELADLQADEDRANSAITGCREELRAVEHTVLAELQTAYLADNPGYVTQLTDAVSDSLTLYKQYLDTGSG